MIHLLRKTTYSISFTSRDLTQPFVFIMLSDLSCYSTVASTYHTELMCLPPALFPSSLHSAGSSPRRFIRQPSWPPRSRPHWWLQGSAAADPGGRRSPSQDGCDPLFPEQLTRVQPSSGERPRNRKHLRPGDPAATKAAHWCSGHVFDCIIGNRCSLCVAFSPSFTISNPSHSFFNNIIHLELRLPRGWGDVIGWRSM